MKRTLLFIFSLFASMSLFAQVDVTFKVDLTEYTDPFTTVFLTGNEGLDNWCGTCLEMTDADNDGIWEYTAQLMPGAHEYKYNIDGWDGTESLDVAEDAACTNGNATYTNRLINVTGATVLDPVCYNSCDACGGVTPDMVSITMNVNMSEYTVSPDGVSLAGGTGFGTPGENPMTDPDGDGVYSITVMRPVGFTSNYTFVNGPAWGDKENIVGQPCADPSNFNDRLPLTVTQDTTINTCFGECTDDLNCTSVPDDVMVTFRVDMNEYGGTFTTPELNGTFNGWCGSCEPMTDADMDGVWEVTIPLTPGNYEYKFSHDNWAAQEDLALAGPDCTVTSGNFINRTVDITEEVTLDPVCWESCFACGVTVDMVAITMNVNMSEVTVSPDGVSLAGGTGFGTPGDNPMTDPDGDGVYSITVMRPVGFSSNYTFVNGSGWGDKENIEGQPCADPGNFNDRLPITVTQDTTINTCFGECTDDLNCSPAGTDGMITFSVDMNEYTGPTYTSVYVNGLFNAWCGDCNPLEDADMDGVWEGTYEISAGMTEFKYTIDGWTAQENLTAGDPCTITAGPYTNRALEVNGDATLPTVCWNSCVACGVTQDMVSVTFNVNMSEETVSPDGVSLAGGSAFGVPGEHLMEDPDGDGIYSITLMRPVGTTSNYTYVNGPEWGDKENIAGLPCSDPDNFNDRLAITLNQDTVINTCFGQCTDDTNCGVIDMASITFNVNMNQYTVEPEGVFLAGGSAFGFPGDNPMEDPDGDGIYTITMMVPVGISSNYTFINGDGWGDKENIAGLPCADPDNFDDRLPITINQDTVINTCFAECTDDTDCTPVNMTAITFNVNMSEYTVSAEGVFLAGGSSFGGPNDNQMEDPDGDGVYSITLMRPIGITSNYTFVNGDWWDDKENIVGLPCADPDNFNDRLPITVAEGLVINTCFAECTDDLNCTPVAAPTSVTFQVNMQDETTDAGGVFIGANFDNWTGGLAMEDPDGDDIWTLTIDVPEGLAEYKFINGPEWAAQEELNATDHGDCTMTTGPYTNRILDVSGSDPIVLDVVCYNSCVNCVDSGTDDFLTENTIFRLAPSLTNGAPVMLYFNESSKERRTVRILNTIGQVVSQTTVNATAMQHAIAADELANGLYYVVVESDQQAAIEKFIVSK